MNVHIKPKPPYDFHKLVHRLNLDPQFKVDKEQEQISFAIWIKKEPVEQLWKKGIVRLINLGTIEQPKISVQYAGDELSQAEETWVLEHLDFRFGWTRHDLPTFYQAVQDQPILAQLVEQHRGLPLVLDEGLFECLIKTIIQQQVNLSFARQLVFNLATEYGTTIDYSGHTFILFPTPSQLAQVEVEALRQRKFSRRKAEYITDLAKKIADGQLDLERLAQADNDTILKMLTKERGIGVWTVECFLLFGLGRPNLFPAGDLGIQKALQQLLALPERPSAEECRTWAKPYEAWGTYLALYLWASLG